MTSSSSLYGSTPQTGNINSSNLTTLYSGNQSVVPNGNLVVPGTLTVNGCAILTNCNAFSLLPTNAESIFFGGAATTMSIGAGTGVTTINNQLATANYTFPVADGVSGQVLVTDGAGTISFAAASTVGKTYSINASATTGGANFNLVSSDPTTDTIKFAEGNNISIVRTDADTITISTVADNIPDGTAKGQLLYWDGSAWTANNVIEFDANVNRPFFVNNVTGGVSSLSLLKRYSGTLTSGENVGQLFGFTDGSAINPPINPINSHRILSEYSSTGNPVYRIQADPIGNFSPTSTTAYNQLRLDNDYLGVYGNQVVVNYALTGAPTEDGIFRVNRGTSTDATLTWDETNDLWQLTNSLVINSDLDVRGGDITNSTGNLNIAPATAGLLNLSVTDAVDPVRITRNTATTNSAVRSLVLDVQSSGTPSVGFANSLEFQIEAQPGNTERAANVNIVAADLTAGSEDFDFQVNLMNNGAAAAQRLRLDSYGILNTYRSTPDTNISTTGYQINVNSTGTVAAGFGTAIGFSLEKADGNRDDSAFIDVVMTDATIGSEDYTMGFGLMQNGVNSSYKMKLDSSGLLTTDGGIKVLGTTSGSSQFTAPATGSTLTYVLPGAAGAANTVLTNDGSGNLSWALPGGGGSTFGNITVGVVTDNTISTTTGDLVLASATNFLDASTLGAEFEYVNVDNQATLDSNTLTTTSTSTVTLMFTTRNVMTGLVNIIQGANVHCVNFTALRVDATTALLTTFGEMYNTSSLASFTADVSGGDLRLLITPASATSTTFSCVRTSLT